MKQKTKRQPRRISRCLISLSTFLVLLLISGLLCTAWFVVTLGETAIECGTNEPTYHAILERSDEIELAITETRYPETLVLIDWHSVGFVTRRELFYFQGDVGFSPIIPTWPNRPEGYRGYLFVPYGQVPTYWQENYLLEPLGHNMYCYTERNDR